MMVPRGVKQPFAKWWWVEKAKLIVDRVGVLNPWILPGAAAPPGAVAGTLNFYAANAPSWPMFADSAENGAANHMDVWLNAVAQHEGRGVSAIPATGHQRLLEAGVIALDPRSFLEPAVAETPEDLRNYATQCLHELDREIDTYSDDPLEPVPYLDTTYAKLWETSGWTEEIFLRPRLAHMDTTLKPPEDCESRYTNR